MRRRWLQKAQQKGEHANIARMADQTKLHHDLIRALALCFGKISVSGLFATDVAVHTVIMAPVALKAFRQRHSLISVLSCAVQQTYTTSYVCKKFGSLLQGVKQIKLTTQTEAGTYIHHPRQKVHMLILIRG